MLEVTDLNIFSFDKHSSDQGPRNMIVRGATFSLAKSESLGIVGESGSGKTMTALSILGLLPEGIKMQADHIIYTTSQARPVHLENLDEKEMRTYRGKGLAMIFQEPMSSLNPSMKIGKQINETVCLHRKMNPANALEKSLELIDEVNLPANRMFYNQYPHQLSGGQRQRVMIAMALAGDPDILIADEPTTALDVTVQKKILELLKQIRLSRGMSLMFISHDLGIIRKVCTRALVMQEGVIVETGKTEDLLRQPQHPYTRRLLSARERLHIPSHQKVSTSSGTPLLEVKNLETEYVLHRKLLGKPGQIIRALDHLSFQINRGETLGLIGESGCGKSTLGRSIIRLVRMQGGEIYFRGEPVTRFRGKRLNEFRRQVQFIFQDPFSSLNPKMRTGQVLTEVMRVHGLYRRKRQREEAARELLEKAGLPGTSFSRYPHEFSGGQRQRIGIARALATRPALVICDEAVSSLDVSVQAQILDLLNELKDEFGLTYLFISHDLAVVRYMSDRIMVMKAGRLLETGGSEDLFRRPQTDYTRELVNSVLP